MKSAFMIVALVSLLPVPVFGQEHPPFGRQLHYAGTRTVGDESRPIAIDVDIGRMDRSDAVTWILVDEHVGDRDLGPRHVTLNSSGVVEAAGRLTFEEETILDMIALQFEDMDGLSAGNHWTRSGSLQDGTHETVYRVRSNVDGIVDIDVSRTMSSGSGASGSWNGQMMYNSSTVAPTSIDLTGELATEGQSQRPLAFSARLVGDSFQPSN